MSNRRRTASLNGEKSQNSFLVTESIASKGNGAVTRTTVVLPLSLDANLELYALKVGKTKGEVIKEVLSTHLKKAGFQPDKTPKSIEVSY